MNNSTTSFIQNNSSSKKLMNNELNEKVKIIVRIRPTLTGESTQNFINKIDVIF